jgi:polyhydroxybutyrate depolymerase
MIQRTLPIAMILLASCSPAQDRPPGRYVEKTKQFEVERDYILRIPKGYKSGTPTPLVFALHGLSGNMEYFSSSTKIEEVADKEGFICVIPNGAPSNFRGWNTGFFAMAGSKDDVGFIASILDKVEKEFTTDKNRTFVFGHSNGAMMSYYLGGLMSDRFVAVAGIAGTIGVPRSASAIKAVPAPKNPISVLMIHGKMDKVVSYKPGNEAMLQCTGAEDGASWWAKQAGCEDLPMVSDFVKDLATLTSYGKGKNGTEVQLISTHKGTHDVPGAYSGNGRESASGVDAIAEIWKFFKSHPRK